MTQAAVAQVNLLTIPYVTVASFKAHPTYVSVANLVSGGNQAAQDAELFNCLLMASAQVDNFCNQPIQAHIQTDYDRTFVDRWGRLKHKAQDGPVRLLQSYTWATLIGQATTVSAPPYIVEYDTQMLVQIGNANFSWTGPLQFNTPAAGCEFMTSWTYVAAYANATMAAANSGVTSIVVSNPTGIFAGDILRIWEPGLEESVVVASSWTGQNTSPFTSATIPLVSATTHAHAAGTGVTGFDQNLTLATTYFCVDGLQRYGTSSANWPMAKVKSASGKKAEDASLWEQKAMRALLTYRRSR